METCEAYDPVFKVSCTLRVYQHDVHLNDDDSGWQVTWKTEGDWPLQKVVSQPGD